MAVGSAKRAFSLVRRTRLCSLGRSGDAKGRDHGHRLVAQSTRNVRSPPCSTAIAPLPPPLFICTVFIHLRNDEKADYEFGRAIAEGRFSDDTIDKHFGGKDEAMHEAARLLKNAAARGHVQDIERHLTLIAEHLNKVLLNIVLRYFTARVVTTFHGSDDRLLIFY